MGLIVFGSENVNSPAERAIRYHWNNGNGNLKHCWIICTNESLIPVEELIASLLPENNMHQNVTFYYGDYDQLANQEVQKITLLVSLDKVDHPNYIQQFVDAILTLIFLNHQTL